MPELPEVETVRRALEPHLSGQKIVKIKCFAERLRTPLQLEKRQELEVEIYAIRRRAKYLIIELQNAWCLMFHLGMTGSFRIEPEDLPLRKHDHVEITLSNGLRWRFNDPRRFGQAEAYKLANHGDWPAELPELAPEPLSDEFDLDWLIKVCKNRQKPIKNLIMDNALVVGVGNIYASESLFLAGIRPDKAAGNISRARLKRLLIAIKDVLSRAIEAGGTTIIDFENVNGEEGWFSRQLNVYGRAGEKCLVCKRGTIRQHTMAGRSSYYCPVCQR